MSVSRDCGCCSDHYVDVDVFLELADVVLTTVGRMVVADDPYNWCKPFSAVESLFPHCLLVLERHE